jgi:hypothetical protein
MQKAVFLLLALVGSALAQTGNATTGVANETTGTTNETSTTGVVASDSSSEEAVAVLDGGAIFMIAFGAFGGVAILGGIGYLIYQQVSGGARGAVGQAKYQRQF